MSAVLRAYARFAWKGYERLADLLDTGPVPRAERKVWAEADSLADLCGLMIRWLDGELSATPGYYGSVDVDEDDAPGLTDACRALNRAGFLTTCSQAGYDGPSYEDRRCTQVAVVDGYATPAMVVALRAKLFGTPYVIQEFASRWSDYGSKVPVTWVDGDAVTRFGGGLGRRQIRREWGGYVGANAVRDLCGALQVVIYDPEPGRNTLWMDLSAALAGVSA